MINNDNSFHLIAEPNNDIHPDDRLNNFKIRLKHTLDLTSPYKVALIE